MRILCDSYRHWTGQPLLDSVSDGSDAVRKLDLLPYAVVSHGTQPDPVFNYANSAALKLFETSWEAFTALPSRFSAEPLAREERERLLQRVSQYGYIDDYSGVRISSSGKRFRILDATVWNLIDEKGQPYGQAALLKAWQAL